MLKRAGAGTAAIELIETAAIGKFYFEVTLQK